MKAFDSCGVDFAGPFFTKMGRGKSKNKRYMCLFTCSATRAVHLELTFGLDTNSFLNAFWRFTHRRGIPSKIVSDNRLSFVSGESELRRVLESFNVDELNKKLLNFPSNGVLTLHTPLTKSMIKAAKKAMYSQLSQGDVSDEELLTIMTGAEAMVNSRPLTYQSADGKDIVPLTPNHFLHGKLGGVEVRAEKVNTVWKRWRRVQEILSNFWRRWIWEWLPVIGKRNKWTRDEQNLEVGDVVLVLWLDVERNNWPLGRIVEAEEGKDDKVRIVKVRVNGKIYRRGLNSIFPLKLEKGVDGG